LKNALAVILAFAFVALLSVPAEAAEKALGTIVNIDGGASFGAVSNLTTITPFTIGPTSLITVQPNAAAYICVDEFAQYDAGTSLSDGGVGPWVQYRVPYCNSTIGQKVAADTAWPSSCAPANVYRMPDGGITSCAVACVPVSGSSVSCLVQERRGNEF